MSISARRSFSQLLWRQHFFLAVRQNSPVSWNTSRTSG